MQKNPTNKVCVDAVITQLVGGPEIADTVRATTDLPAFLTIRKVEGGGKWRGEYLGKAVRWYHSTHAVGPLTYKVNGYTVARSDDTKALMELPVALPDDLDYPWYIAEAQSILQDIGVH